MAEPETQRQPSNPFGALFTLGGVLLQMLGLSGMADNAVEWRGFFERGVMRHYSELEGILVAGPVPPLWSAAIGYLLSCVGFFLAAFQTMQEHQRYLANFSIPRDYMQVEEPVPVDERGIDKVEAWAHRRSRGATLRLLIVSLVWPVFMLWALYVWVFAPKRKLAVALTEAEMRAVELSGFDYGKAARREAFAFLKWSLLSVLGFLAILFISSDFLSG